MSRVPPQAIEPHIGLGAGDYQYPPQSAQNQTLNQASHGISNFVDGSGPIFQMYSEMASEEDKKMTEGWKADADGILIFTGLFSAAVASLISVSIQDIRPNPQDTSNFYLANIYQTVSNSNQSNIPHPSSPPPFSPPTYALWVNSLWFLSLVISLTCALLATLLQQWARRYLRVIQSRYSPHKRARIRAFFAEGVDKFLLPWAVETLPALLHVSLFLFFAGLVIFLSNDHITIFKLVLSWVGICTALYGCITITPIFLHDSPYYTPLSLPVWNIVNGIPFLTFRALRRLPWLDCFSFEAYNRFQALEESYRKLLVQGMQKAAEETALDASPEIDTRMFLWTFDCLDEDHELERFFSGLPGFRSSKVVEDPLPSLTEEEKQKLSETLIGFSDRTFSSDLLPEPTKIRRAVICAKAFDAAEFPNAYVDVLKDIVFRDQHRGLQTTEFGRIVRGCGNSGNQHIALLAQATVSIILVRAKRRDDSWYTIASSELCMSRTVLRDYAAHGDSLSLAVLIHVTRQQFSHFREAYWAPRRFLSLLETASKFTVQDTSPELQHEFCALWNRIVLEVQNDNDWWMAYHTLVPIRNVYIALHQDTISVPTRFSASTGDNDHVLFESTAYPVCNVAGHIHNNPASTSFARSTAPAPASLAGLDVPSSSRNVPLRVVQSPTSVPLLNNTHPALQTTAENRRVPPIIPGLVAARVMQSGTDTSTTTIPLSTPEPSVTISPASIASTPAPGIAIQRIPDHRTSDLPDVASLLSSIQVPDDMPTTVPHASLPVNSSVTRSGRASLPDSHPSPLVPASPDPSHPWLRSAPDPGAVVEVEGSAEAVLHQEWNTLDPPSAIRENVIAMRDLPPQSPSSSSATDVAIMGPSWHALGDHSP